MRASGVFVPRGRVFRLRAPRKISSFAWAEEKKKGENEDGAVKVWKWKKIEVDPIFTGNEMAEAINKKARYCETSLVVRIKYTFNIKISAFLGK